VCGNTNTDQREKEKSGVHILSSKRLTIFAGEHNAKLRLVAVHGDHKLFHVGGKFEDSAHGLRSRSSRGRAQ